MHSNSSRSKDYVYVIVANSDWFISTSPANGLKLSLVPGDDHKNCVTILHITIDTVRPDSPVVWFPVLSRARQYKGITCNARGAPSHHVFGYGSAQLAALASLDYLQLLAHC